MVTKGIGWEVIHIDKGCTCERFQGVQKSLTCFPLNDGAFGDPGIGMAMTNRVDAWLEPF
jgi:hypothetical protein